MKRVLLGIVLSLAVLTTMLSGLVIMPAVAENAGNGDCNGDGKVDIVDLMMLTRYVKGETSLSVSQETRSDIFTDGIVDVFDAMCLYNHINDGEELMSGAVEDRQQTYATFALETVLYEEPVKAGETVAIALTSSQISELVGLELHIAYDTTFLHFQKAESAKLSLTANTAPRGTTATNTELWLTMLSAQEYSFEKDETVATLYFEAATDIVMDTTLSFTLVNAVSSSSLQGRYSLSSMGSSGGVMQKEEPPVDSQTYVTYTIETLTYDRAVSAGETVQLNITSSAVADINGLQINVCYDDTKWEWFDASFAGEIAGFSYKIINTNPSNPVTEQGEVWLSAMDMKGHTLSDGDCIATITLKALCDISTDCVIGACYSQASSYDGTIKGYEPVSEWVDGGVKFTLKTFTGPFGDYFYKNNVMLRAYQLVEHNGDYYFISDAHKIAKNKTYYLSEEFVAGTPLKPGTYEFGADGKMVIKNGPVGDYFYKDNAMLQAYQLVEYNGDYYFISDAHKIAKNKTYYLGEEFVAGTPLKPGTYEFGADGKLIIKNGPVGDYFYENNTMLKAYRLVEFEGNYYFIGSYNKITKNETLYLTDEFVAGTALTTGYYEFDADGKLIVKNGPVGDYFYKDNTMLKAYKLVEYEGDYYFISSYNKIVKSETVYLSAEFVAGTTLTVGYYEFDADGKMIVRNGPVGDYFYENNTMLKAYQLVEYEGNYYFISSYNKIVKSETVYLSAEFVTGTSLTVGYYEFDADGKMIVRNGPVGDYFYENNAMLKAYQLVEYEGDYYFISSYNKIVKSETVYLGEEFVAGTPFATGSYEFDADGKMIVRNGPVGDYFYENNTMLKAYQLVEYEGNYYFVSSYNKIVKSETVYLSEEFVAGTPFAAGSYEFDADGKMIVRNGPVGDYFYRNNVQLKAYQIVEYEGDYYFIGDGHKVVRGVTLYLAEDFVAGAEFEDGTPFFAGYYTFDENGRLVR